MIRPSKAPRSYMPAAPPPPPPAVPFRDLDVPKSVAVLLDFEAAWRRSSLSSRGLKAERAKAELGLTLVGYVKLLRRAVTEHTRLALEHDPQLTHAITNAFEKGAADRRALTAVVRKDR